jgi:hypothetical protein
MRLWGLLCPSLKIRPNCNGYVSSGRCEKIDFAEISSEPKCMLQAQRSLIRYLGAIFQRPKLLHVSKSIFSHLPVTGFCRLSPGSVLRRIGCQGLWQLAAADPSIPAATSFNRAASFSIEWLAIGFVNPKRSSPNKLYRNWTKKQVTDRTITYIFIAHR